MKNKKIYIAPEVEVVIMTPVSLLTASFSDSLFNSGLVDDPFDIL